MGITVVEPRKRRNFDIAPIDELGACRKSPRGCVVARAFMRQFSDTLLEVQVFATKTTLTWSGGRIERYETPKVLGNALRNFDLTGEWKLPPGKYTLEPLRPSKMRKVQRERAAARRAAGDTNMDRVYPKRKKHKVPTRDRILNLVVYRNQVAGNGK